MLRINKLFAVIILIFFVVSCGGGDGNGDGGSVIDVAPGFDATAGDIDEDGFQRALPYASG